MNTQQEMAKGDDSSANIIWDRGGPEFSPLRFWVKTRDKVCYTESIERQKVMVAAGKAENNLTAQQVDAKTKSIFENHDKIGGHHLPTDMGAMARSLQGNAADGAYDNNKKPERGKTHFESKQKTKKNSDH